MFPNPVILDNVNVGDEVIINFSIRGNEYNGKYYVNLNGQTIDIKGTGATTKKVETVIPPDCPSRVILSRSIFLGVFPWGLRVTPNFFIF